MPEVSVQIANRNYELACGDGEEERVQELAAYVDEKVVELRRQLPGTPEVKLLVFAALILADESREARGIAKAAESAQGERHRQRRDAGDGARGPDHLARRQDEQEGERGGLAATSSFLPRSYGEGREGKASVVIAPISDLKCARSPLWPSPSRPPPYERWR